MTFVPIIIPHIAASGAGAAPNEAGMASVLAFGSIIGLKVLVCILIALVPLGAVVGWRDDRSVIGASVFSLLIPTFVFTFWVVLVAVAHGMMWVFA